MAMPSDIEPPGLVRCSTISAVSMRGDRLAELLRGQRRVVPVVADDVVDPDVGRGRLALGADRRLDLVERSVSLRELPTHRRPPPVVVGRPARMASTTSAVVHERRGRRRGSAGASGSSRLAGTRGRLYGFAGSVGSPIGSRRLSLRLSFVDVVPDEVSSMIDCASASGSGLRIFAQVELGEDALAAPRGLGLDELRLLGVLDERAVRRRRCRRRTSAAAPVMFE